jgi:RNA polymerase-associated protein CTR9
MLLKTHRHGDAQELLKSALTAEPGNLEVRAAYTNVVLRSGNLKNANDFVFATLKDHAKHDLYALCAAANIHYTQARESRDQTPPGIQERKKGFQRAAEFYEKALSIDTRCAVAAQGLAIVTAEDALGTLGGALPPGPSPEDSARRVSNAREALDVLGKVRECIDDGSVYVNMGHCYYARDEFDRAIESVCDTAFFGIPKADDVWTQYEAASRRYYEGRNVPVLLCLCRSWYAKATKDQSFAAINTALQFAQQVGLRALSCFRSTDRYTGA